MEAYTEYVVYGLELYSSQGLYTFFACEQVSILPADSASKKEGIVQTRLCETEIAYAAADGGTEQGSLHRE